MAARDASGFRLIVQSEWNCRPCEWTCCLDGKKKKKTQTPSTDVWTDGTDRGTLFGERGRKRCAVDAPAREDSVTHYVSACVCQEGVMNGNQLNGVCAWCCSEARENGKCRVGYLVKKKNKNGKLIEPFDSSCVVNELILCESSLIKGTKANMLILSQLSHRHVRRPLLLP